MPHVNGSADRRKPSQRLSQDERREQILKVAQAMFRKRPYGEISLDAVAKAAGVARGLINHYFGSKRDLYVEVVRRTLHGPLLPVPGYVHGATLERRVNESITRWLDIVERNPNVWLDSGRGAPLGDAEIAAIIEDFREGAVARMAEVAGLGPVNEIEPRQLGMMRVWAGMAEAAFLQWIDYGRLTREDVNELLIGTVFNGLQDFLEGRAPASA